MYPYPDFPDHVYVELTNLCNARCTICATPGMKRPRTMMPIELFRKVVEECGRHGAKKLLPFLHGESLLVPDVLDYFREARRLAPGTHINLTTNGSRLSAEMSEVILREELIDSLIVSIDGGDKKTFEGIRLGLDYDQVRDNVKYFLKRRELMSRSTPKVSIAMVTIGENKESRDRFKEEWVLADEVRFSVYFNWAGRLEGDDRTPNRINFCERIYHYITILADGRVALCCFDSEAEFPVGDIKKQSLSEIWHSEAFHEKRRWLYEKNFERLGICGKCDYINHPGWMTPLLRLRPNLERRFPRIIDAAGRIYKRWLTG